MIWLITGATHTGKTLLSQKLMEQKRYPYMSIDHLKMGLIRSGQTDLTPDDDEQLTQYLWPIVREVVKTAIENDQNLIVEGCYIPFNWRSDFGEEYLQHINYVCLVMRREYIENHFADILANANAIERRLYDSGLTKEMLISENEHNLHQCIAHNCRYIEISNFYRTEELLSRLQSGEKLRR